MEPPRRRRRRGPPTVSVGRDEGMRIWVEAGRPGLHFVVDDREDVVVSGTWQVHAQGLVLVEISIRGLPFDRPQGLDDLARWEPEQPRHIPGSVLRTISVPELERRTRAALRRGSQDEEDLERTAEELRLQGLDLPSLYAAPRAARDLSRRLRQESFRPGRQGYPFGLYEWVAKEYLRLSRRGSRKIVPELAERATEHLGWEVSVSKARDWVHRARELGLLTKGSRGKAGAEPGPALHADRR